MGILCVNLTPLEYEQLRYIAEHVEVWPSDQPCLWISLCGEIRLDKPGDKSVYVPPSYDGMPQAIRNMPTYSRDFTRAEYDAMRAELEEANELDAIAAAHEAEYARLTDDEIVEMARSHGLSAQRTGILAFARTLLRIGREGQE